MFSQIVGKLQELPPLLQNGEKTDHSNYRPISVLPFSSRVFEKLVYTQLYEYLDEHKHLFSHQSGFRCLHSAVTPLLNNTNDWYVNIDNGKYTAMVFIDLKEAFDTVNHQTTENKNCDDNHICIHSKFDNSKVRQARQIQDRQFQVRQFQLTRLIKTYPKLLDP